VEQTSFQVPEHFVARLKNRFSRFQDSARTIAQFVAHTEKSVASLIQPLVDASSKLRMSERFYAAAHSSPEADAAQIDERAEYIAGLLDQQVAQFDRYPGMLFEMAFIYFVAAFEGYMQDVTEMTLLQRPETLKSGKQLSIEKIVDLTQRGILLQFLAEREVVELGYRSFAEQANYYREKFKLEIAAVAELEELIEIHARRNLYVHNGGVVNARYTELVVDTELKIGQRLQMSSEYWINVQQALTGVASHVRDHLTRKFGPELAHRSGA
jgi:hypothetical protein